MFYVIHSDLDGNAKILGEFTLDAAAWDLLETIEGNFSGNTIMYECENMQEALAYRARYEATNKAIRLRALARRAGVAR